MRRTTALSTASSLRHVYARALSVGQSGAGVVLLTRPHTISRSVTGRGSPPPAWLVQALGARLVVQGLVLLRRPTRGIARVSAAVDTAHGLSMVVAAAVSRRHRRAALISAVAAASSALAAMRLPIVDSRAQA